MILLWGLQRDSNLAAVTEALLRKGASFRLLDQDGTLATSLDLSVGNDLHATLYGPDSRVDLAEIRAAYLRPTDWRRLGSLAGRSWKCPEWQHACELHDLLWAWADLAAALVVNRPYQMASNSSKPYQLDLIRRSGFAVPETIVTTDVDAVMEFWLRHGDVVYKSVSGVRSMVAKLTNAKSHDLANLSHCPTQFQEYVEGVDYRVHVVGDRLFCSQIESDAIDYRYAGRQEARLSITSSAATPECAEMCHSLAAALGLVVTGIDLRRTADGRWFCFEANPSPAFSFYDREEGRPIAEALADVLAKGM